MARSEEWEKAEEGERPPAPTASDRGLLFAASAISRAQDAASGGVATVAGEGRECAAQLLSGGFHASLRDALSARAREGGPVGEQPQVRALHYACITLFNTARQLAKEIGAEDAGEAAVPTPTTVPTRASSLATPTTHGAGESLRPRTPQDVACARAALRQMALGAACCACAACELVLAPSAAPDGLDLCVEAARMVTHGVRDLAARGGGIEEDTTARVTRAAVGALRAGAPDPSALMDSLETASRVEALQDLHDLCRARLQAGWAAGHAGSAAAAADELGPEAVPLAGDGNYAVTLVLADLACGEALPALFVALLERGGTLLSAPPQWAGARLWLQLARRLWSAHADCLRDCVARTPHGSGVGDRLLHMLSLAVAHDLGDCAGARSMLSACEQPRSFDAALAAVLVAAADLGREAAPVEAEAQLQARSAAADRAAHALGEVGATLRVAVRAEGPEAVARWVSAAGECVSAVLDQEAGSSSSGGGPEPGPEVAAGRLLVVASASARASLAGPDATAHERDVAAHCMQSLWQEAARRVVAGALAPVAGMEGLLPRCRLLAALVHAEEGVAAGRAGGTSPRDAGDAVARALAALWGDGLSPEAHAVEAAAVELVLAANPSSASLGDGRWDPERASDCIQVAWDLASEAASRLRALERGPDAQAAADAALLATAALPLTTALVAWASAARGAALADAAARADAFLGSCSQEGEGADTAPTFPSAPTAASPSGPGLPLPAGSTLPALLSAHAHVLVAAPDALDGPRRGLRAAVAACGLAPRSSAEWATQAALVARCALASAQRGGRGREAGAPAHAFAYRTLAAALRALSAEAFGGGAGDGNAAAGHLAVVLEGAAAHGAPVDVVEIGVAVLAVASRRDTPPHAQWAAFAAVVCSLAATGGGEDDAAVQRFLHPLATFACSTLFPPAGSSDQEALTAGMAAASDRLGAPLPQTTPSVPAAAEPPSLSRSEEPDGAGLRVRLVRAAVAGLARCARAALQGRGRAAGGGDGDQSVGSVGRGLAALGVAGLWILAQGQAPPCGLRGTACLFSLAVGRGAAEWTPACETAAEAAAAVLCADLAEGVAAWVAQSPEGRELDTCRRACAVACMEARLQAPVAVAAGEGGAAVRPASREERVAKLRSLHGARPSEEPAAWRCLAQGLATAEERQEALRLAHQGSVSRSDVPGVLVAVDRGLSAAGTTECVSEWAARAEHALQTWVQAQREGVGASDAVRRTAQRFAHTVYNAGMARAEQEDWSHALRLVGAALRLYACVPSLGGAHELATMREAAASIRSRQGAGRSAV